MDVVRIPSNVSYFRDLLQNHISSTSLEDHRTALRDTPFVGYLDVPNIPIHPVLVDCLLEVFDAEKNSFKIGGKWTSFSVQDVARITGLPMGGSIVDTRFHRSDRETIYKLVLSFRSKTEIMEDSKCRTRRGKKKIVCARRGRMGELIQEMAERRDPLVPQMLVAFIIGFILCPQANMGCPLFAFRYAEKLDTLNEYNWAEAVFSVLRTELVKSKKTITKRSEGNRSRGGYMGGFASVLVIWFYELVGKLSLRVGAESLPPILSFYKCPKPLRRIKLQNLVRDPDNFSQYHKGSRSLQFQKRIDEAATSTKEATSSKFKGKVITEADLDRLIHEKKVELNLLEKMKREMFGGRQEDVDSDIGDEDDGDDEDDSDGGDEDDRNEEDDRDEGEGEGESDGVGDKGEGGDVDEDEDVDRMNVDKDDGGDGANDDVVGESIVPDDDDFLLSPRDIAVIEGKRKTPSIKRTVLSRSRLAGPSTRDPFVSLCNPKGAPKYPGRKEVSDDEREVLDNFWRDIKMTMETVVWSPSDALVTRKDALELLKGEAIGCDVIALWRSSHPKDWRSQ